MSRLSKLYEAIETLRNEGLSTDDLEEKVSQAEEDIIKKEILPVLTRSIEPALQQVKRELVLVVDYQPGHQLSLHISRKQNVTADISDAKEIVMDPEVEHAEYGSRTGEAIERSSPREMKVIFTDGTTIAEQKAADTLVNVVSRIGVARVRQVVEQEELVFNKVPVVSNRRDSKYGGTQRDMGDGWLLMTHCSSEQKKKFLDKISEALNLGLKVVLE